MYKDFGHSQRTGTLPAEPSSVLRPRSHAARTGPGRAQSVASLAQEAGRNLYWTCGLLAPGLTGAKWRTPPPGPTYSTTRTKLALLCLGLGDEKGGACTLHSPKNPLQAAANQMRFGQREMAIVGRWPSTSRMPEKYDRGSARASCSYATLSCRKSPMCGA